MTSSCEDTLPAASRSNLGSRVVVVYPGLAVKFHASRSISAHTTDFWPHILPMILVPRVPTYRHAHTNLTCLCSQWRQPSPRRPARAAHNSKIRRHTA